ncbi:putative calcium-binding protein [Rosa sericea]
MVANRSMRDKDSNPNVHESLSRSFVSVEEPKPETRAGPGLISCTTFNILAPIYKRLDQQNQGLRESQFSSFWVTRNQKILDWLLYESSAIICLQEFWVGNEEFVNMYLKRLGDAGYSTFKLARTNDRGDGLLTAVRSDCFRVLNYRELHFNDFGDRVAQLLHVQLTAPFSQIQRGNLQQEILIVNTHLLFPHDSSLCIVRLHQVYKILQFVEAYQNENKLNHMPIILCGDWNGSKRGHVYKFLRSQGFESTYDTAHQYTDNDAHKWVSHRNHRGNICGVDFIWLCNPNKSRKPLKTSWCEAVFGILRRQLRKASMAENDAFAFLKGDNHGDFITSSAFCEALHQVNLIGHPSGLGFQETRDLWIQADTDANGVLDYEEFKNMIWSCTGSDQKESLTGSREESEEGTKEALGFKVKNAVLYPSEAERGIWPENYTLSDHARLTVVLSAENMWCCSQS